LKLGVEHWDEITIPFDGRDRYSMLEKPMSQRAEAGSDLDHAGGASGDEVGELRIQMIIGQKVLAEMVFRTQPVALQE
jgi:hypothetical protein